MSIAEQMNKMNKYFVVAGLSAWLVGCSDKSAPVQIPAKVPTAAALARPVEESVLTEQAKAAAQALGSALKAELETAMTTGGPVAAMSVCQIKAPELAKAISIEKGIAVRRVSLKNRNPVMGVANELNSTRKTRRQAIRKVTCAARLWL